ncbi:MAG TPA: FAD-dependent oxidoreductase [Geminicoccaceae bacterium]|nr:FAD-dependent oxidoreductase [Geminicoccaceae bacterium]
MSAGTATAPGAPLRPDPAAVEARTFDLIVVGGGIQGATIALEATRRGRACLLLERAEFGAGASGANLRILHGGLRHLQRLQPAGAWRSLQARAWFLRHFPDQVAPLACVMPLDGRGLRRVTAARVALAGHRLLARLAGVDRLLPGAEVLDARRARELTPGLALGRLAGAVLWHDALMRSPDGIVREILGRACAGGLVALSHVRAESLVAESGRVQGVLARDELTGAALHCRSGCVVEATGPGPGLDGAAGPDVPSLVAFNLLLDRRPPAGVAVAGIGTGTTGRALLVVPLGDRVLAGTWYVPDAGGGAPERIARPHRHELLRALATWWPGLAGGGDPVVEILAGRLPAAGPQSDRPSRADIVLDAARWRGPSGYVRACGTKFTTAPALARRVVDRIFGRTWLGDRSIEPVAGEAKSFGISIRSVRD